MRPKITVLQLKMPLAEIDKLRGKHVDVDTLAKIIEDNTRGSDILKPIERHSIIVQLLEEYRL